MNYTSSILVCKGSIVLCYQDGLRSQTSLVHIPTLPLISCVTLSTILVQILTCCFFPHTAQVSDTSWAAYNSI